MSRQNAALGCRLADEEEIVELGIMLIVDHIRIDNGSGWWISDIHLLCLLEESLVNPFVNDD